MKNSKLYLIGPTESILTKRGNRFPNLANFFADENETVIYYTSNFYHAEKRFFSNQEIKEAKNGLNYKLHVLKVLGYYSNVSARRVFSNFFFSFHLFIILLFKVSKKDRVLLPSRPVELIYFMALLKRIKGVKIYLDIQDIWPDALEIEDKRKKKIFETYCNSYLKPSLKYYTNTLHVAPSFKQWLHRYAKDKASHFVPLGWENERWADVKFAEVENFDVIKMVCVAQLQHQIDIMPILKVLKNNNALHLTVLGEDGTGERYEEVMAYINKNDIKNIEILGKIDRIDMLNYLEDKHIGILPMITSAIPNKIFDYMAAMLPIIVLGKNDSSDFVIENNIGWQCNFNSEDLGVLLQSLKLGDIQLKKKEVVSVRQNFSRNVLHKKVKDILV